MRNARTGAVPKSRGSFMAWSMATGSQLPLARSVRLCGASFEDSTIGTVRVLCDDHVVCTLSAANKNAPLPEVGGKVIRCEGTAGAAVVINGYDDRRKRSRVGVSSSVGEKRKRVQIGMSSSDEALELELLLRSVERRPMRLSQERLATAGAGAELLGGPAATAADDSEISEIDTEADLEELSRALDLDRNGRIGRVKGLRYETSSWHGFLSSERAEQV